MLESIMITVVVLFSTIAFLGIVGIIFYYSTRSVVEYLAEMKVLFFSVGKDRIVATTRSRKITGYFGNLNDHNVHVNRENGEVEPGKEDQDSFLWEYFGVRWLGFDKIHNYPFDLTTIDKDGVVTTTKPTAESIYYKGSYFLMVVDVETREGTKITLKMRVNTLTQNAGKSLGYKDWLVIVTDAVKSACRDFIGNTSIRNVLTLKNEGDPLMMGHSDFIKHIINLNTGTSGNMGLIERVGQEITSVNVMSVEINDPAILAVLNAESVAEERGKGLVREAEKAKAVTILASEAEKTKVMNEADAKLYAKQKEADGQQAIGQAENVVIEGRVKAVKGARNFTEIEKWRNLAQLKGTLVFGSNTPPMILPSQKTADEEETK